MSYSRWSNSRWYTYASDDPDLKEVVFTICEIDDNTTFTYKQISKQIDTCLKTVKQKIQCTDKELLELKKYMLRFKLDCDEERREMYRKNANL